MNLTPDQITKDHIYICGPITNVIDLNKPAFYEAEKKLNSLGFKTVNPHQLFIGIDTKNFKHQDYLDVCISFMSMCGTIVTLENWHYSEGATQEVHIGRLMKKEVHLYKGFINQIKSQLTAN